MAIKSHPNKIEALSNEYQRIGRRGEEAEIQIQKRINRLLQETNSKYYEPYVRVQSRELDRLLKEIRQLSASLSTGFRDTSRTLKDVAARYRQDEETTKRLFRNKNSDMVGVKLKLLRTMPAFFLGPKGFSPKKNTLTLSATLLGKGKNHYTIKGQAPGFGHQDPYVPHVGEWTDRIYGPLHTSSLKQNIVDYKLASIQFLKHAGYYLEKMKAQEYMRVEGEIDQALKKLPYQDPALLSDVKQALWVWSTTDASKHTKLNLPELAMEFARIVENYPGVLGRTGGYQIGDDRSYFILNEFISQLRTTDKEQFQAITKDHQLTEAIMDNQRGLPAVNPKLMEQYYQPSLFTVFFDSTLKTLLNEISDMVVGTVKLGYTILTDKDGTKTTAIVKDIVEGIKEVSINLYEEGVKFVDNPGEYLSDKRKTLEITYEEFMSLSEEEKAERAGELFGYSLSYVVPIGAGAKVTVKSIDKAQSIIEPAVKSIERHLNEIDIKKITQLENSSFITPEGIAIRSDTFDWNKRDVNQASRLPGDESGYKGIGNFKHKKISETPAEEVNKWWKEEMGYSEPPYKTSTLVQEIELTEKSRFVRVYDGDNSGMYGGWFMKADDIKGLTPSQIQEKFALPTIPKYVADVELDAGTRIRTGTVNPIFGFEGGGQQFDLMGQRVGNFTNPRPLP